MILGDSLLVMASLAEKEGLKGKVQMIYMDPPYGIGFSSNWQAVTPSKNTQETKFTSISREPEVLHAFKDTWREGIHSYLTYLRDRLQIARVLLADEGSLFFQIGSDGVHAVRIMCEEIFGADCFVLEIAIQKTGSQTGAFIQSNVDRILWFVKNKKAAATKYHRLFVTRRLSDAVILGYDNVREADGTDRALTDDEVEDIANLPEDYRLWASYPLTSDGFRETTTVGFHFEGRPFHPGANRHWGLHPSELRRVANAGRIVRQKTQIRLRNYFDENPAFPLGPYWSDIGGASGKIYVVQTNVKIVERCMLMSTDPGDLVIDPTCGSGTTAFVAENWGADGLQLIRLVLHSRSLVRGLWVHDSSIFFWKIVLKVLGRKRR